MTKRTAAPPRTAAPAPTPAAAAAAADTAATPALKSVKVLKPFRDTDRRIVHPGETVTVDEGRHKALARNGLVEPPAGSEPGSGKTGVPGAITHGNVQPRRRSLTDAE